MIGDGRYSDLGPVGRSFHLLRRKDEGEYSLLLCILAHSSLFVAPSVLPINIKNSAKMMDEPGNPR